MLESVSLKFSLENQKKGDQREAFCNISHKVFESFPTSVTGMALFYHEPLFDSRIKYVWVIIDTANKRILQSGLRPRGENGWLQKPQLFSQLAWLVGEHWLNGSSSGISLCWRHENHLPSSKTNCPNLLPTMRNSSYDCENEHAVSVLQKKEEKEHRFHTW